MKGLGIKLLLLIGGLIGLQSWNFITQNLNQELREQDISDIKNIKLKELKIVNEFRYSLKAINELYGMAIILGDLDLAKENANNIDPFKTKVDEMKKHQVLRNFSDRFLNDLQSYLSRVEVIYLNYIDNQNDKDHQRDALEIRNLYKKILSDLEDNIKFTESSLESSLSELQEANQESHFRSNVIHIISIIILIFFGYLVHDSLVRRLKTLLIYLTNLRKNEEIPLHKTKNDEIGQIENQIIDVQQDLLQAKSAAEQANQSKAEFLANMNHELRTPLHGIMGMNEYLKQSDLDEQQSKCIDIIDRSSHLLSDIVNDILEISKLNNSQISLAPQPTELAKVFDNMEKILQPTLQEKQDQITLQFNIDTSVPGKFWIDPKRLNQLLLCIIGNAIKFSESGNIEIKAKVIQPTELEHYLQIKVQDQGIGIPPEQLSRLFEVFTQVDESSTRTHGGTGLGLAICKGTIKLMGGKMGVESQEGEGSTFWFKVPIKQFDAF